MNLPSKITAGDKIEFTESNDNYPASAGWTAKYRLINSSGHIDIISTADGDNHSFILNSADTALYTAGGYDAILYFDSGVTQQIEEKAYVSIEANPLVVDTYDTRSHARRTLELIETAIEGRLAKQQMSIQITTRGGSSRMLQYLSPKELIEARAYYKSLVAQEDEQSLIDQGKPTGKKILLSFK